MLLAIGVFVLLFLVWAALFAFDAYLLSVHIPTLIDDPTNFGAWVWVVVALTGIVSLGSYSTSKDK